MKDEIRRISSKNIDDFRPVMRQYRKVALTSAARMRGPFQVDTAEGPLVCQDGYLAVDARGYPYPIDAQEFEMIYDLVEAE